VREALNMFVSTVGRTRARARIASLEMLDWGGPPTAPLRTVSDG